MRRFNQIWSSLRSSFWFIPTLMVVSSVALAVALVETDSAVNDRWLAQWPRLFGATPEGARQLLATIAGSMMTVMGVTFSMTLVALALASSQYTSRILRTFMRSRVTQSTLGIFAGIFAYCLIVLHTIRSGVGEAVFVPGLALFFAFVLALGGVGVLIYFIHHIASSIQASSIIASVAEETIAAIDRLLPAKLGHAPNDELDEVPQSLDEQSLDEQSLDELTWHPVTAKTDGYIQNVDSAALMRLAQDKKVILRMERGVGEFVVQDTALASLALEVPPDQETIAALNAAYIISSHRTVDRDLAFGVRQIVDMALKALSPGVNDTSTAVMCVDYLTAILARLATRKFPALRHYHENELRVIAMAPTFESLLSSAFDQIRRNAEGNVSVMSRMLGALDVIASQTDSPRRRLALGEQVQQIAELADCTIDSAHDRARLEAQLLRVRKALEARPVVCPGFRQMLGAPNLFRVFRLPRSVTELVVVADSFHNKPLWQFLQSVDRYQVLGLSRDEIRLFEGDRDALEEIELAVGVPRSISDALGSELTEPHQMVASYGGVGGPSNAMHHSHGGKADEVDIDADRFFRSVDRAVLEHHSRPTGLPLILAALAEHHHRFRDVSHNPLLLAEGIEVNPKTVTNDVLRTLAWRVVEPHYEARLTKLKNEFEQASAAGRGSDNLAQIGAAAASGRVATLFIEADRQIAGHLDEGTGKVVGGPLSNPRVDDVLGDLGELVGKMGGEVLVIPTARMPTRKGAAAIYRY